MFYGETGLRSSIGFKDAVNQLLIHKDYVTLNELKFFIADNLIVKQEIEFCNLKIKLDQSVNLHLPDEIYDNIDIFNIPSE